MQRVYNSFSHLSHVHTATFIAARKKFDRRESPFVAAIVILSLSHSLAGDTVRSIKIAFLSIAIVVNSITLRHRANPPGKDYSVPLLYDDAHHRRASL